MRHNFFSFDIKLTKVIQYEIAVVTIEMWIMYHV